MLPLKALLISYVQLTTPYPYIIDVYEPHEPRDCKDEWVRTEIKNSGQLSFLGGG